jgi:DNA-directed RNA polymerase
MTTVYGVTRFGARLQIAKQLKGIFKNILYEYYTYNIFIFKYFFERY